MDEKQLDAVVAKTYLITKTGVKAAELNKQKWGTPEEIIESVVKLHGQTLENYRNSGLG